MAVLENLIVRMIGDASSYLRMINQVHTATSGLVADIERMGASITKNLTVPLTVAGAAAVGAFAQFDKAVHEASSVVAGEFGQNLNDISKSAKLLSLRFAQAPHEIAKGFYFLGSAGYNAAQSIAIMPDILNFAAAGAFNLDKATDLATTALAALGMRSDNAAQNMINLRFVMDQLTSANKNAEGSVEQFSKALTRDAGATAKVFGMELEDVMATLMVYGRANMKAEFAGSSLGRTIRLLTGAATKNQAVFDKYNIKVFDPITGNLRKMYEIVEDLENALNGMSDATRTATLEQLGFKALVQRGLLPLIGMSKQMREFRDMQLKAAGATKEMSQNQLKAFANQMKMVWNLVKVVAIETGEALAPAMRFLASGIVNVLTWWRQLNPETKRWVGLIVLTVAALGPLILMGGLLSRAFGLLLSPIKTFVAVLTATVFTLTPTMVAGLAAIKGAALMILAPVRMLLPLFLLLLSPIRLIGIVLMGLVTGPMLLLSRLIRIIHVSLFLLFSPIGLIVAAVLGLVAVVTAFVGHVGGLKEAWEAVRNAVVSFWEWTQPIREALMDLVLVLWDVVVAGFQAAGAAIMGIFSMMFGTVEIDWQKVVDTIVFGIHLIEYSIRNFGLLWKIAWATALLEFITFGNQVSHFFTSTIPAVLNWFATNWREVLSDAINYVLRVFLNFGANVIRIFRNLPGLIRGRVRWDEVWHPLTEGFQRTAAELNLPVRIQGQIEQALRREVGELNREFEEGFDAFRDQRLNRLKAPDFDKLMDEEPLIQEAERTGRDTGAALNKGFGKEVGKWEAALANTSEALFRLAVWRDQMVGEGGGLGVKSKKGVAGPPQARGFDAPRAEENRTDRLLTDIRDLIKDQGRAPRLELERGIV